MPLPYCCDVIGNCMQVTIRVANWPSPLVSRSVVSRLFRPRAEFWVPKNLAGRSIASSSWPGVICYEKRCGNARECQLLTGGGVQIENCEVRPDRRGPHLSAARDGPRAALPNFAGRITMLIFGPSAGHNPWRRGPHLARGPHFWHHCSRSVVGNPWPAGQAWPASSFFWPTSRFQIWPASQFWGII
jgi:hypothetical protein